MMRTVSDTFRKCWVQFQIHMWRQGWVLALLVLTLACAACLQFVWMPQQSAQLIAQKNDLKIEQNKHQQLVSTQSKAVTALNPSADKLKRLSNVVYAQKDVGNLLQLITQIAKTKNISLTQSEIQTIKEGHGGLQQLQVTLPIRTGYLEMRQFIQEVLRQLDGVSVDQISIKRDSVAQGQLEARIKLSMWLDPNKQISRTISHP